MYILTQILIFIYIDITERHTFKVKYISSDEGEGECEGESL